MFKKVKRKVYLNANKPFFFYLTNTLLFLILEINLGVNKLPKPCSSINDSITYLVALASAKESWKFS